MTACKIRGSYSILLFRTHRQSLTTSLGIFSQNFSRDCGKIGVVKTWSRHYALTFCSFSVVMVPLKLERNPNASKLNTISRIKENIDRYLSKYYDFLLVLSGFDVRFTTPACTYRIPLLLNWKAGFLCEKCWSIPTIGLAFQLMA